MARTRNQVIQERFAALTAAQVSTLRSFGVTVDEHGRVRVAAPPGYEVVVDSGNHEVFVYGAVSGDTLLAAHGRDRLQHTHILSRGLEDQPERHVGLATIRTERG